MLNQRSLVLNKHWVPIATIPIKNALIMLCRGTSHVICPLSYELYDLGRWIERSQAEQRSENVIKTPRVKLHRPEVMLLQKFGGIPRRQLSFTRKNLYRRDNYTCQYCGQRKPLSRMTIDHVVPRAKGGESGWDNCVLACVNCNTQKADKLLSEVGYTLCRPPRPPSWNPLHEVTEGAVPESWAKFLSGVPT